MLRSSHNLDLIPHLPRYLSAVGAFACLMLAPGPSEAQVVLQDNLTSASGCTGPCVSRTVEGAGSFSAAGWQTLHAHDRIIYDIGQELSCGVLQFTLANFAPWPQYQGTTTYKNQGINFLGLFENSEGSHGTAIGANESVFMLKYAANLDWNGSEYVLADPGLEWVRQTVGWVAGLQVGPCDQGASCANNPEFDWAEAQMANSAPDTPSTYVYRLEWNTTGIRVLINGTERAAHPFVVYPNCCHLQPDVPRLRYLYVGKTTFLGTDGWGYFKGPIYSNITVERCQDPCEGHCGNGIQDCGEEGIDCGGTCPPCNTPPKTGKIRVYDASGARLDEGGPPAHRGDTITLRAAVDDDETEDKNMVNPRFFLRSSGSAEWNVLDGAAATFDPNEPELNWFYTWTIPMTAPLGVYDIRFDYADEAGAVATQTQTDEFTVIDALTPDGGTQEGGAGEAGTTHDAGSDARPDSSSSAEASPEGSPSAASSDDSAACGTRGPGRWS